MFASGLKVISPHLRPPDRAPPHRAGMTRAARSAQHGVPPVVDSADQRDKPPSHLPFGQERPRDRIERAIDRFLYPQSLPHKLTGGKLWGNHNALDSAATPIWCLPTDFVRLRMGGRTVGS